MPRMAEMIPEYATIGVPIGDETLTVVYRPHAMTLKVHHLLATAPAATDLRASLLGPLVALLHSWDLTDDDGAPIPIDADTLVGLPLPFLTAILTAIGVSMAPPVTTPSTPAKR